MKMTRSVIRHDLSGVGEDKFLLANSPIFADGLVIAVMGYWGTCRQSGRGGGDI